MEPDWRTKAALPVREAGEVLSVGRDSVYRMIRDGEIRGVRLGGRQLVPVVEILRIVGEERPVLPTPEEVGLALLTLISDRALPGRHPATGTVPPVQSVTSGEGLGHETMTRQGRNRQ